jgi:hypothetical protein
MRTFLTLDKKEFRGVSVNVRENQYFEAIAMK